MKESLRINKITVGLALVIIGLGLVMAFHKNQKAHEQKAVELVRQHEDVKAWLVRLDQAKATSSVESKPVIEFDHRSRSEYVVHVYELVKDPNNRAHSAT